MVNLESDYNNGMHPEILRVLVETNAELSRTYGFDRWSDSAKEKIRKACNAPSATIYFIAGGTQTNKTVIDSMLHSWEGPVAADTGHINVHEAGAVEFTGHKVLTLPNHDGKIDAGELKELLRENIMDPNREHMVYPGLVYITFPTELGTMYSAREIEAICNTSHDYGIPLFIDGARLGYGLAASKDITLPWLAAHCDAFYIGGTKCGAIIGEAVVFPHGNAPAHFFTSIKQHGSLLAKGRLTGIQFDTLFTDGLYTDICRGAIAKAMRFKRLMLEAGFRQYIDSPTNQQFFVIPDAMIPRLQKGIIFETWGKVGEGETACRFVTSWATKDSDMDEISEFLNNL